MARLIIQRAAIPATKQYKFHCHACGFTDQFVLATVGESAVSYDSVGLSHMMESLFGTQSEKAQLQARANAVAELDRTQSMVACPKCKAPRASKLPEQLRLILATLFVGALMCLGMFLLWILAAMLIIVVVPFPLVSQALVVLALAIPIGYALYKTWQYGKQGFAHLATLEQRAAFWTINPERWTTSFGDGGVLSQR